ncbi:MAG: Rossmann-like and DUF2520 domain-containing protein [Acidobacteriota bacterium]
MKPLVTILGAGAVGSSLALALRAPSGAYALSALASRSEETVRSLARRLRTKRFTTFEDFTMPDEGLILIAVPDDALPGLALRIAHAMPPERRTAAVVLHTSGALGADVLSPLREKGASVGSFHPLMLFPRGRSTGKEFARCPVAIEGDALAVEAAEGLAAALQARPFRIATEKKTLYHIAAVFASNYFVTLLSAVGKSGSALGLPPEETMALFTPLIRQTLGAVLESSPGEALTGPIVRNDCDTLRRHLDALREFGDNDLLSLYIELGLATAHLAREHE